MKREVSFSYGRMFIEMLIISAFTFGGGFVIIGMMRKKFCDQFHWVSDEEVLDMTAIAQSAPGALAVNSAIIFGYRMGHVKGAFLAVLATIIPPIIIISVVCMIYNIFSTNQTIQMALRVMRAGVGAIITDVVIDLAKNVWNTKNLINIILMIVAFIASWLCGVSSITIILIFIALGIALNFMGNKKEAIK